jgi:hypothetical protein
LGIFLLSKVMDGRVLFYISQRFVLLVLLGAVGLIGLAQLVLRERPTGQTKRKDHNHAGATRGHDHSGDRRAGCCGWWRCRC